MTLLNNRVKVLMVDDGDSFFGEIGTIIALENGFYKVDLGYGHILRLFSDEFEVLDA